MLADVKASKTCRAAEDSTMPCLDTAETQEVDLSGLAKDMVNNFSDMLPGATHPAKNSIATDSAQDSNAADPAKNSIPTDSAKDSKAPEIKDQLFHSE